MVCVLVVTDESVTVGRTKDSFGPEMRLHDARRVQCLRNLVPEVAVTGTLGTELYFGSQVSTMWISGIKEILLVTKEAEHQILGEK